MERRVPAFYGVTHIPLNQHTKDTGYAQKSLACLKPRVARGGFGESNAIRRNLVRGKDAAQSTHAGSGFELGQILIPRNPKVKSSGERQSRRDQTDFLQFTWSSEVDGMLFGALCPRNLRKSAFAQELEL